ncbi:MAG: hypothetical protein ACR2QC_02895 [Gammaproteobacteria bacterium]
MRFFFEGEFLRNFLKIAPSARRFRLSPEWRCFLVLRTIPSLAVSENIKKTAIPAKAGISFLLRHRKTAGNCTPSATVCAFRRGDSCLRRNGTGGELGK